MNKIIMSLTNAKRALESAMDYVRGVLESEHFPTPENADQRISNRRNLVYAFDYLELAYGEVEYSLNRLSKLAKKTNKTANQNETEKQRCLAQGCV
jgi:hypothetical protein